jgi:transposase
MSRRKKYNRDFKINAIKLYEESGMKLRDVEKELGIGSGCISHWRREFEKESEMAFPGNGSPRDKEIARLKKENNILKQERDILKKALGIFSKPQGTGIFL